MSKRYLSNSRDLGELGEDLFKIWCTSNNLVAVKAVPDRMGWDYIVEFPPEVMPAIPLDRQNDLKKVFIQVKSTDKVIKSVRGKLSAFKRLVDTDWPAFIAHINFAGQAQPKSAALLHIGPNQIKLILKKVRLMERRGRIDLNNFDISLSLEEAGLINVNDSNIKKLILEVISKSTVEYVTTKSAFRRTCGYDSSSIKAYFSLAPGVKAESLVDLMIGRVPNLPFKEMVVSKTRFGIELDNDIDRLEEGILSVKVKPLQQAKIVVTNSSSSFQCEMKINVFAPGIPGLPKKFHKIRLANEFIELVLDFGDGHVSMSFKIDQDTKYNIDELSNALKFGYGMAQDGSVIQVNLGQAGKQSMPLPIEIKKFKSWRAMYEFAEMISIALFTHRRGENLHCTLRELESSLDENANMFSLMVRPGLEMTFPLESEIPQFNGGTGVVFLPACIEFKEVAYFAIVQIEAEKINTDVENNLNIVGGQPVIIEDGLAERSEISVEKLNNRAAEISKSHRGTNRYIITTTLTDPNDTITGSLSID